MKYVFQGSKNPDVDAADELRFEDGRSARVGEEIELSAAELEVHSPRLAFEAADDKGEKSLDKVEAKVEKEAVAGLTDAERQVLGLDANAEGAPEEVK